MKEAGTIKKRIIILLILALTLGVALPDSFAAAGDAAEVSNEPGANYAELKFADDSKLTDVISITYPFLDTAAVAYDWSFPYSDDLFRRSPDTFSMTHAQAGLGLALSAFRSTKQVVPPQYEKYLGDAGFSELFSFGYDEPTSENSLSGVIGMKQIDDFTVIAAVTCGQGYEKEWAGNFIVGTGARHEGFDTAASVLEANIKKYIDDNDINGRKKLWLGGISRAAAIANLAAGDVIESGEYEAVYAYLFGVPRTTKEPVNYGGIYNICGQYDPVAATPLDSWGYERYGLDIFTPAQETDADYPELAEAAAEVGKKLDGKGFRNNPEVNYQLRLIIEWIDEFFKDSDDYNERLAPLLADAVLKSDPDHTIGILKTAVKNLMPENEIERESVRIMADYLSYIVAQHTRANQRQIESGSWDTDESLEANLVIEHRGSTYTKWMFANLAPKDILSDYGLTRRLMIIGKTDVGIFKDAAAVSSIASSGKVTVPGEAEAGMPAGINGVFMMRNGDETVVSLPGDEEYRILIEPKKIGPVTYYDLTASSDRLITDMGDMHIATLNPGKYTTEVVPDEDIPDLRGPDGKPVRDRSASFKYSPTVVMGTELAATRYTHMSLSNAIRLILWVLNGMNLLLIVCIIIYFVHRRSVKKGHPPYSDWYVIVPHLIFIASFAAITQLFAFFLSNIGGARAECAALTVLFLALLALRGSIRSRKVSGFIYSLLLFGLIYLTASYYTTTPIESYSKLNMIVYFVIVFLLSVGAVMTFKRKAKNEEKVPCDQGALNDVPDNKVIR